jgi:hypothetical protein
VEAQEGVWGLAGASEVGTSFAAPALVVFPQQCAGCCAQPVRVKRQKKESRAKWTGAARHLFSRETSVSFYGGGGAAAADRAFFFAGLHGLHAGLSFFATLKRKRADLRHDFTIRRPSGRYGAAVSGWVRYYVVFVSHCRASERKGKSSCQQNARVHFVLLSRGYAAANPPAAIGR